VAWLWDFGDGATATTPNPVHTYLEPGTYSVRLTVTTTVGSLTVFKQDLIHVTPTAYFGVIGPEGGEINAPGIRLFVPSSALPEDVVFMFKEAKEALPVHIREDVQFLSAPITISHNGRTPDVFASRFGKAVDPAQLTLYYAGGSGPTVNTDTIFVLVKTPDGRTWPLSGTVNTQRRMVTVPIMRLPSGSVVAVLHRPEASSLTVSVPSPKEQVPGGFVWKRAWKVTLGPDLLKQLTTLYRGSIEDPSSFEPQRFTFSQDQFNQVQSAVTEAVRNTQLLLEQGGFREPLLSSDTDTYVVHFFNTAPSYVPPSPTPVSDAAASDHTLGQIVIDPRWLLSLSQFEALQRRQTTPPNPDAYAKVSFPKVFGQELFRSVFEAYRIPSDTVEALVNPAPGAPPVSVPALLGLKEGLALFIGQVADGDTYARRVRPEGPSPVQWGVPLFAAVRGDRRPYWGVANEFFMYLDRNELPLRRFEYLTARNYPNFGLLEALREERVVSPTTEPSTLETLLDNALRTFLPGSDAASLYLAYVRNRAIEHAEDRAVYPSEAVQSYGVRDLRRFEDNALRTLAFRAPTDTLVFPPSSEPSPADASFMNVPPLTSRAFLLKTRPLTTRVRLTFNREDWDADSRGNTVVVRVYREGMEPVDLPPDEDTVVLDGFDTGPEACGEEIFVLVSNLNLEQAQPVTLTAQAGSVLAPGEDANGVLDTFVQSCDPEFAYELVTSMTVPNVGLNAYVLELTSGIWRNPDEVDRTLWKHFVSVLVPPIVVGNTGLLVISGGDNTDTPPMGVPDFLVDFALKSRSVVALLQTVPNQPLVFPGDTHSQREEDEIIAYSYRKYMDSYVNGAADFTWPTLLPMTRAAVRAMDAVQEFLATKPAPRYPLEHFVVTGASKRGWTTWLTGAADPRVTAIMPVVIDVLNMDVQMQHHFNAYGFYAPAIADYLEAGVFDRLGTPEGNSLLRIVDPYEYRDRYTMPKLMLNSTGDQFFVPDSAQFYFNDLPGEKHLHYVPNTDHSLITGGPLEPEAVDALLAFYLSILRNVPRPQLEWVWEAANRVRVTPSVPPKRVLLWQADNENARDFRKDTIGQAWTSTELSADDNGDYVGEVAEPSRGWRAFFVQVIFTGPDPTLPDLNFIFTTDVRVVPDVYPPHS
jgi:PhoPQ-activated pathogenicity-related protein